jgi:hypothetical protein
MTAKPIDDLQPGDLVTVPGGASARVSHVTHGDMATFVVVRYRDDGNGPQYGTFTVDQVKLVTTPGRFYLSYADPVSGGVTDYWLSPAGAARLDPAAWREFVKKVEAAR